MGANCLKERDNLGHSLRLQRSIIFLSAGVTNVPQSRSLSCLFPLRKMLAVNLPLENDLSTGKRCNPLLWQVGALLERADNVL